MRAIEQFVRGEGPEIETGYRRGDSWRQIQGKHAECEQKVVVIGPGVGRSKNGELGDGVLVRCYGCFLSWVIR